MKIFGVFLCPFILFAQGYSSLKLNEDISLETLQNTVPRGVIVSSDEVKKDYKRKLFFAKKYLKNMTRDQELILDLEIINLLSTLEIKKLLAKKALKISDDVSYSYYLANKQRYILPATFDLYILTFNKKEDADKYEINRNIPKPESKKKYRNFEIDSLTPNYVLALHDLKENTLTKTYKVKDKFIRVYFANKKDISYVPYEQVKQNIVDDLLQKKQREFLNEAYKNE